MDLQHAHAAWTRRMGMWHGACSTVKQHEQAAGDIQRRRAYTLLKNLAFPPPEGNRALEPGFQWCGRGKKKREFSLFSSALVFLRTPARFFAYRSGAQKHEHPPVFLILCLKGSTDRVFFQSWHVTTTLSPNF
jgi:hypothetical protein